jgi:uncharacterized membrane protein
VCLLAAIKDCSQKAQLAQQVALIFSIFVAIAKLSQPCTILLCKALILFIFAQSSLLMNVNKLASLKNKRWHY